MRHTLHLAVVAAAALSHYAGGLENGEGVDPGAFVLRRDGLRYALIADRASGREILRVLAAEAGAEIECPAGWDAPVTARLQDADFESLMQAVAGNWALVEQGDDGAELRRRIVVFEAVDRAVEDAASLYQSALEAFESPTRDEERLVRLILARGWTEDGRALGRLFEANAESLAAFKAALEGRNASFDWGSRSATLEAVQGGHELVDVYLVSCIAALARGDSCAFADMALPVKFAADVGRDGPVEAKTLEGSFRRQVLAALNHSASRARMFPAAIRSALRTLEFHAADADEMAAAVAWTWPHGRVARSSPEGEVEVPVADLAAMPPAEFAPALAAALRGDLRTPGMTPSDLSTLRRALERRAQADRQETLTRLRLAALAYGAERGAVPAAPRDLVPGYLAAVPADPMTGKRLDALTFAPDGQLVLPADDRAAARPRSVPSAPREEAEAEPVTPDELMPPGSVHEGWAADAGEGAVGAD